MSTVMHKLPGCDDESDLLTADARWLLAQRIVSSDGFSRAGQLRDILLYVSRSAILNPGAAPNQHELACNVLHRQADFDPANDNIVRAQFKHLRRRLDRYFAAEGAHETLRLTVPKGSYAPVFAPKAGVVDMDVDPAIPSDDRIESIEEVVQQNESSAVKLHLLERAFTVRDVLVLMCVMGTIALLLMSLRPSVLPRGLTPTRPIPSDFMQFLSNFEGNVTIVIPDTSEMLIQLITGTDISPSDYIGPDYPERQIDSVKDPNVRKVLTQLAVMRNTTSTEAAIASDFSEGLRGLGVHSRWRYARDLHMRDFKEGNTILIGSHRSNPWVALFANETNFRFIRDPIKDVYYIENRDPQPEEQLRYEVSVKDTKDRENYVDIALVQNPTKSGYILLINGTDLESNEAASNLLIRGRLPAEVNSLIAQKDLRHFEVLLKGRHLVGEAEDSLQVISIRPGRDDKKVIKPPAAFLSGMIPSTQHAW